MNDMIAFGVCFAVAVAALAAFFFYNTYRGVNDSLANSAVGSVYNFRYYQPLTGDYDRYLAKVIYKQDMKEDIARLNRVSNYRRHDGQFIRTNTLVTCQLSNGDIRNFYAERSGMCKRTAVGNLLFKAGFARLF
ncbi:MAG: hypothetical protein ACKOPU_05680 [Candidatus Planktophila sp.]